LWSCKSWSQDWLLGEQKQKNCWTPKRRNVRPGGDRIVWRNVMPSNNWSTSFLSHDVT
jgi:hypothetical protein